MKLRLLTGLATGALGVAGGIGVAIWQHQQANMLGIAIATGVVGLVFGLVFELT